MSGAVEVSLSDVIKSVDKLEEKAEKALEAAVMEVALAVERVTKQTLNNNPHRQVKNKSGKGSHWEPGEHIGGPGTPPNRRSGNLMRSVRAKKVQGFGSYSADVSPGMIYSRRLEVSQGEGGFGYPYLRPSADRVRPKANKIATLAFMKHWRI